MAAEPAPAPDGGLVYVPDVERARHVPQPGEIIIGDAQLAGMARILGPAVERVLARKRAQAEAAAAKDQTSSDAAA